MSLDTLSIPEAATKYGVDAKRLRGAIYMNGLHDPIGDPATDRVQDDATLERWVAKHKGEKRG